MLKQWKQLPELKLFRTLRFRLAAIFLCVLAAVLFVVFIFGTATLRSVLENQSEDELNELLGTLKDWPIVFDSGDGHPYWSGDVTDPDDKAEVTRLKAAYAIADSNGHVYWGCDDPSEKPICDPATIRNEFQLLLKTHQPYLKTVRGTDGTSYQVLSSLRTDPDRGTRWYFAEGRALTDDRVTL